MATSYTYNGITFSNFTFGVDLPGKYGNTGQGDYELTGEFEPFVNAVEVDWNGAKLGNYVNIDANGGKSNSNSAEINTTYELICQ